jgi:tRNA 2-selenouridine synthase
MLVLEDESRGIGKLTIPETWYQRMQNAELIILTIPTMERIENIRQEYVDGRLLAGIQPEALKISLQNSLVHIKNRLGGQHYQLIHQKIENAFQMRSTGSHEDWIHDLIKKYYDPMYSYQLKQKRKRCVLEGDWQEIRDFLIG